MRLVHHERHVAEPRRDEDGIRARHQRRDAAPADGVPHHVVQRDGEEQEQAHAPRVVQDAQQQVHHDHDERIGKLHPRFLERAQIMLAHGNGPAHFRSVFRTGLVERVEALAVDGVAARVVPAVVVHMAVAVSLARVAPAVEPLAVDDHAVSVHHELVALVVAAADALVRHAEPFARLTVLPSLPVGILRDGAVLFRTLHVDAVPAHVHFLALLAVLHVHAVAPRHVHVVVAVEHVDASQADAHLLRLVARILVCGL